MLKLNLYLTKVSLKSHRDLENSTYGKVILMIESGVNCLLDEIKVRS